MLENEFQAKLIKELKKEFSGCLILKNDSSYLQGIPDLIILYEEKWAALEVKRSSTSRRRPNQDYYIHKMNNMSYSSYVYPENKDKVLQDLRRHLIS